MNAVRNNWERCVRRRLSQRSHFHVPCKYCITEIPAVSCRLGIPHSSEMSTLTGNLSQDQNCNRSLIAAPADTGAFWSILNLDVCLWSCLERDFIGDFSFNCEDARTRVSQSPPRSLLVQGTRCNRWTTSQSLNKSKYFTTAAEKGEAIKLRLKGHFAESTVRLFQ